VPRDCSFEVRTCDQRLTRLYNVINYKEPKSLCRAVNGGTAGIGYARVISKTPSAHNHDGLQVVKVWDTEYSVYSVWTRTILPALACHHHGGGLTGTEQHRVRASSPREVGSHRTHAPFPISREPVNLPPRYHPNERRVILCSCFQPFGLRSRRVRLRESNRCILLF
jgi:hypothetical protein